MKRALAALFVLLMLDTSQAQTGIVPPSKTTMTETEFIAFARRVQLANTGSLPWAGSGELVMIQGRAPSAALETLQDDLAHGFVDCTGTFACIGASNYPAQNVRFLSGANLETRYTTRMDCRWVGFSWSVAYVCPEQYVVTDAPQQSIWFWKTRTSEYLITGSALDGGANRIEVVSGSGFLTAMRDAMMLGRVLQTARRVGGGSYSGAVESTYSQTIYSSLAQVASRVLNEDNVTILGGVTPALEAAIRTGRGAGLGPINIIAHRTKYPNFGPCRPLLGRAINYYLFDTVQPAGAMVIVRRAGGNEIISGSLIDGIGTRATVGIRGNRFVERIIAQLNVKAIIDQTYIPSESFLGLFWMPCR